MTRGSESKRLNGGTVASPGFRETRVHYVPKPHRGASSNRDVEMSGSVAVELFRVSPEVLKLSLEDRRKYCGIGSRNLAGIFSFRVFLGGLQSWPMVDVVHSHRSKTLVIWGEIGFLGPIFFNSGLHGRAAHGFMKKSGPDGTFPKNSLTKSAEMTFLEVGSM
eukprot:444449-Amorphochlora_amoeboformis.AAC.1